MSTTKTVAPTLQAMLDQGRPSIIGDAFAKMKFGTMFTPLKRAFTGLTGAASYNLTALDATGETTGPSNPNRLAARDVQTLRVTAATTANTVGSYIVGDVGATAISPAASTVVGLATLSDDGTTLVFPTADVTAFVIEYEPRAATNMTAEIDGFDTAP